MGAPFCGSDLFKMSKEKMSETKKIKMIGIACDGEKSYFPGGLYDVDAKTAKDWVKAGAAELVDVDPEATEKKAAEEAEAKEKEAAAKAAKAEAQKTENAAGANSK